jgi:Fe-S cluster assembly protein SufD
VHVIFITSGAALASSRLFVTAGQDSRMSIVEHHFSAGAGVSNIITEAHCRAGADLDFLKLQAESDDAIHLAAQSFEVAARAKLQLTHLDLGARLARNDLTVTLRGEGGEVSAQGLFLADGARHLDNHTRIEHLARHTTSRETYRGIANQTGRGVFNGKIIVFPGADQTDARLTNQNLLLARGAEVDTKPELEIYADDVKCSHGATIGRLDAQAIFYLRSRGIDEESARRMLVSAFAGQIVGSIQFPALREHLAALLRRRLGGLADDGRAA